MRVLSTLAIRAGLLVVTLPKCAKWLIGDSFLFRSEMCESRSPQGERGSACGSVRILTFRTRRHELRADVFGMLAQRRHPAVAARFALDDPRRRRIADRPARRFDPDAAQMRKPRQAPPVAHPAGVGVGTARLP